jgi:catalase
MPSDPKSALMVGDGRDRPVDYDAVVVPGGEAAAASLVADGDAVHFVQEAYKHCKAIAALGEAVNLVIVAEAAIPADDERASGKNSGVMSDQGVVTARASSAATAIAEHRRWSRCVGGVPA